MKPSDARRAVGLLLVLGLAAGCGGGGGGGSSVDPNAPVIVNLQVAFGGRCTLPNRLAGTIETLTVDYTDADGTVTGGTLENTSAAAVGDPIVIVVPIPSPGVRITGTTSGSISIAACLRFGSNSTITEQVKVTDASGKVSNLLSIEVTRPAGAPLLPQDADPALRKSL